MSTSGTVGRTQISVTKLIEHAIRRCGLTAAPQTAETLEIAKQNLFTMLLASANRGFYLWCLEKSFVGLTANQATYDTPVGTVDVSDVIYSTPTRVTGIDTITTTSHSTELTESSTVVRVGFKFDTVSASDTVTLETSEDSILWTAVDSWTATDWQVGVWYWKELDPTATGTYFRTSTVQTMALSELYLASAVRDLPVSAFSRDVYSTLNDKYVTSSPSTNYLIEKKTLPTITLWPVPDGAYNHLTMWVHRQIQDVGALTNELEIPNRWLEAVIWQLAFRLSVELPGIDPSRITMLAQMSDKYLIEAEKDETDGMPTFMQPNIGVYNA